MRPEDLIASDDDDYLYQGEVDLIEALGELTVLYFKPDARARIRFWPSWQARMRSCAARP